MRNLTEAAVVQVTFDQGTPVAVNGVPMPLDELIASLDVIAGPHGVGRAEAIEADAPGAPETPAATVLQAAQDELRRVTPGRQRRGDRDQPGVTGFVRIELFAGRLRTIECASPFAQPDPARPRRVRAAVVPTARRTRATSRKQLLVAK